MKYVLPAALAVFCLTSRILFIGQYLGEWDEVDFALALRDYDIAAQQPHFPGYPVYILLSRLAMRLTKAAGLLSSEVSALNLVSAFLGGVAVLPLYYLARSMYSRKVAVVVGLFFITNPACWLYSEKPLSEATALSFLLLSLHFLFLSIRDSCSLWIPLFGAFFMGITLGVRLDYFPFLSCLIYVLTYTQCQYSIFRLCFFGAFALGVALWLFPLVMLVGPEVLLHQALSFTYGHFSDWGGSFINTPNPAVRLGQLLWDIFPAGLGLWWIDLPCIQLIPSLYLLLGLYTFLKEGEHGQQRRFFLVVFIPYLLWVFFAQNLEKPRHVLPLIPLLLVAASAGTLQSKDLINQNSTKTFRLGLLILPLIVLGVFSLRLVHDYSQSRPPLMELVNYVQSTPGGGNVSVTFDQLSTRVYCGDTKRLFEYYAPGWDARRVRNWEGLRYDFRASICPPPNLLVTSEVVTNVGCPETEGLIQIKSFEGDKYIYAPYHKITLLRVNSYDF